MKKYKTINPIDGYLKEKSSLNPYLDSVKSSAMEELRRDVNDETQDEKRYLSVILGSPVIIAKILSIAHDKAPKLKDWRKRVLTSSIGTIIIS